MNQTAEVTQEQVKADAAPDMDSIEQVYYSAEELPQAQEAIAKVVAIVEANGEKPILNFDPEKDFPDGYGIVIQPINERQEIEGGKSKTVTVGCGIGAVPDYTLLSNSTEGKKWIQEQVQKALCTKFANSIRRREDGEPVGHVPFTVEDFITTQRVEGVLVAYRTLVPDYIKALKKQGLRLITEQLLRQVLQSKAFAEQHFPQVKQAVWEKVLASMIANAEKQNLAPGSLIEWRDTRNSAGLPEIKELSLDDFDF